MKDYRQIRHHFLNQIASETDNSILISRAREMESLLTGSSALRYPDQWPFPGIPHEKYDENKAKKALGIAREIVDEVKNIIDN